MISRSEARRAGIIYLLLTLLAPFVILYVPGGSSSAETRPRRPRTCALRGTVPLGIGSELVHQAIVVFLVLVLYRLFAPVDVALARQLVALGALVSVPIMFVNVLNEIAALTLAKGADFLSAFDRGQLDGLASLFLRLHGRGVVLASVFWGLWLFPFGILVIRSRFIPRLLGYLLFVAGSGYLAAAFAILILPSWKAVVDPVAQVLELGEIPIIFWLLIWGARPQAGSDAMAGAPA